MTQGIRINGLREMYRSTLFDEMIPWWEKHSIDWECGGYLTRLDRNGTAYAGDKDMWMTARQIWMFSHLYRKHEEKERWRELAEHGLDFMMKNAFREDGTMYFRLDREGRPLSKVLSLYTEVFATMAVAEYAEISQSKALRQRARIMYDFLMPRLGQASDTPMLGYPLFTEFHLHAHDMCRITVARVFRDIWPQRKFEDDINTSINSILSRHWKAKERIFLENVAMDGTAILNLPEGRLSHPGHAIETAWMLMEIALERKEGPLMDTAIDMMLASLEQGWDREFGGIRYLTHVDGTPTHALEADLKLWWPHGEALYALLLAYLRTGRKDLETWYIKVHRYTFDHFPDKEQGEWYGYLNREGSPVWQAKANGWKGFFHLPRALFRAYQLLCEPHYPKTESRHA
ncbi:AGE family epimerase/isomerase [Spongiimicrobium sp. 2-473A-2-J]|uniref:AGE family epimerase/isomerase n=1 Tax=Eudoraea algarum TaxID=3417568 RepID=UPI003D3681C0